MSVPLLDKLPPDASVVVEVSPERLDERGRARMKLLAFLTPRGLVAAALESEYSASSYTGCTEVSPVPYTPLPSQTDCVFLKGTAF